MSVATPFNDEQLREFAQATLDLHDPAKQQGEGQWPDRCAHCHYTRHPCDTFDLAAAVLRLLERVDEATKHIYDCCGHVPQGWKPIGCHE